MPPRMRMPARREASHESAAQHHDPPNGRRGRSRGGGRRGVVTNGRGLADELPTIEVPRRRRGNPGMVGSTAGLQGLQQVVQQLVGVIAG